MSSKHLPAAPNRQCTSQCLFEEVALTIVLLLHPFRPKKCQAGLPQKQSPKEATFHPSCVFEGNVVLLEPDWGFPRRNCGLSICFGRPFGMTVISSASTFRPRTRWSHTCQKKNAECLDDPRQMILIPFDTVINVTNRQRKITSQKISSLEEFFELSGYLICPQSSLLFLFFFLAFRSGNQCRDVLRCFGETPCICGGLVEALKATGRS